MMYLGYALAMIAGLGSLVCWVMVLIQLFQRKGVGLGIFGIICGLFTFIWGWMTVKETGLGKVMKIWTACIVLSIIGNAIAMPAAMKMQQNMIEQQGGL